MSRAADYPKTVLLTKELSHEENEFYKTIQNEQCSDNYVFDYIEYVWISAIERTMLTSL